MTITTVDPTILLYAARYAFGRQTSAPRDALSAIVINADAIRCEPGICEAIVRLLRDEWHEDWDHDLASLRHNALRMLEEAEK